MTFSETPLAGAYVIEGERARDERGDFLVFFSAEEFGKLSVELPVAQAAISRNERRATLRGLHYQLAPHAQRKLVHCSRGAIYDAIVDVRRESESYGEWFGVELREGSGRSLYVPEGVAHGFQTLEDRSEVTYLLSAGEVPTHARGIRWDDPAFGIEWPSASDRIISARDLALPDFRR